MPCRTPGCGCGFVSETLNISEVSPGVWSFEQAEFTTITELEDAVAQLQADVASLLPLIAAVGDLNTAIDDRFQAAGETVVEAFTPGSSTVGTPAGNNWVTLTSSLTVPPWCTRALVTMHVNGVFSATNPSSWILLSRITGTSASSSTICHFPAATSRKDISWASAVSSPSTGTQSLIVHATRTAGTGILTADPSCRFSATVVFQG